MKPKMKPNLALSVPYFTASICFIAAVITRSMVWMVVGVICLAAASFLSYESAKRERKRIQAMQVKRSQTQADSRPSQKTNSINRTENKKKNNRKS
ncbi:hypothetical protein [Ileibacterium valens]|uniref:hypothetical protein n=1 Tax=Ileibacterium valens TaxID=1862668 RepID=UPI0024B955CB|nr:hypothetical protein [Ileibacterium valens]